MREPESIANAPVDDLCEERCASCGTPFELTRVDTEWVGGVAIGRVLCTPCVSWEAS